MNEDYLTLEDLCARWGAERDAVMDRLNRSEIRLLIVKDDILALEKELGITTNEGNQ